MVGCYTSSAKRVTDLSLRRPIPRHRDGAAAVGCKEDTMRRLQFRRLYGRARRLDEQPLVAPSGGPSPSQ